MVDMKEAKRDTERVLDLLYATQVGGIHYLSLCSYFFFQSLDASTPTFPLRVPFIYLLCVPSQSIYLYNI